MSDEITVKVAKLPGGVQDVAVPVGATVCDVLKRTKLSDEGFEIRVNGNPIKKDQKVTQNDTILLVRKIRGNRR